MPVESSEIEQAFADGRRKGFEEIRSLAPHEVTCKCPRGGEFDMNLHDTDCPRWQLARVLAVLEGDRVPSRFFELSPADARLLVGDLSDYGGSQSAAMTGMLALDSRMRVFLGKDPEPDKGGD